MAVIEKNLRSPNFGLGLVYKQAANGRFCRGVFVLLLNLGLNFSTSHWRFLLWFWGFSLQLWRREKEPGFCLSKDSWKTFCYYLALLQKNALLSVTNQLLPGCLELSQVKTGLKHWGFCQFDFSSILQCALSSVLVGRITGCPQPQLGKCISLSQGKGWFPRALHHFPPFVPNCVNVKFLGLLCPFVSRMVWTYTIFSL